MGRIIDFCGQPMELADYEEKHRYRNQTEWVDEIPINPELRSGFDCTPNYERDDREIADWWGKPYIRTDQWINESYSDYCTRVNLKERTQSEAQFLAQQKINRDQWYAAWPEGTRYDVRVLDGGAWDRSTSKGAFATLGDAIAAAKKI